MSYISVHYASRALTVFVPDCFSWMLVQRAALGERIRDQAGVASSVVKTVALSSRALARLQPAIGEAGSLRSGSLCTDRPMQCATPVRPIHVRAERAGSKGDRLVYASAQAAHSALRNNRCCRRPRTDWLECKLELRPVTVPDAFQADKLMG